MFLQFFSKGRCYKMHKIEAWCDNLCRSYGKHLCISKHTKIEKTACITFVARETTVFAYGPKQNEVNHTSLFWGFGSESQCYKMHKIQVVCDSYADIMKNYAEQPVLLNCTSSRCKCATLQFQNHNCQENELCLVQCSHLYKFFFF